VRTTTTKKPDGQVKDSGISLIFIRSWGGGMQMLAITINREHHLFDYILFAETTRCEDTSGI